MATADSIGQRFVQLIQHLGMSKNAFAQSLDKTATVVQHLVEERNKPGYDLLCKVFEIYPNVSKDWLLLGQGPMLTTEKSVAPALASPPMMPAPAVAADLVAATGPPAVHAPPATAVPVVEPTPLPAPVVTANAVPAAALTAPDASYLAVALQTQYLQHQLALAEQRNQHLLEQQALMQQLVAVLQRSVG